MKSSVLSLEWKSEGVMDDESGDGDRDDLRSEWDKNGEADGLNLEVDSKDEVMHI